MSIVLLLIVVLFYLFIMAPAWRLFPCIARILVRIASGSINQEYVRRSHEG
jgi:hypothetical protein